MQFDSVKNFLLSSSVSSEGASLALFICIWTVLNRSKLEYISFLRFFSDTFNFSRKKALSVSSFLTFHQAQLAMPGSLQES